MPRGPHGGPFSFSTALAPAGSRKQNPDRNFKFCVKSAR